MGDAARHIVFLIAALAVGIALGAVTKFGFGRDLAVTAETPASPLQQDSRL
jgi:hypothetical protein